MSNSPETGIDLEDLELQLLPAWAKQSPDANRYAKYEGGEGDRGGRDRRDRRGPGTDRPGRQGGRGRGEAGGPRPRRPREERGGPPPRVGGGRFDRGRREEPREAAVSLPELSVAIVPEEKGVESLARQIRLTGRAYPVFDIAHLVLKRPDRYRVTFSVVKKPDGQVAQPLWLCGLDDTLWLSDQEAVEHVLRKHFDTFYKAERTPTDPPKGTYTFVAQCGLSGVILGPPNYHDYQNKLRKLHSERFSRMPFDVYKSRVRIVKDEAVVKKWIEDQSWKTQYSCLNVPEAKTLANREEVEQHFREVHFGNIIRAVDSHTLLGAAAQQLPAQALRQLLRHVWDEQQRFPLRVVTTLSQQFAGHGLQFFKVNKSITHVAVARPHYLDMEATPVSEGVKRIVDHINARSGCTRRQLIEALAPSPSPSRSPIPAPAAVRPTAALADGAPGVEPETIPAGMASTAASAPVAVPGPSGDLQQPTPEQTAVIADLHWLIHQGHVIEFANGKIETAKKPLPRPPKPAAKVSGPPAQQPAAPVEPADDLGAPTVSAPISEVEAGPVEGTENDAAPPAPATPSGPPTPAAIEAPTDPAPSVLGAGASETPPAV